MNNGEQVLDRPLRGLGGAAGRRGLRPLPLGLARRAAGDCCPYHGVGTVGRRGLRPLPLGLARRVAGDCGPYRGPLGANVRERNINELEQGKYGE